VHGRYEAHGRTVLATEWFEMFQAPRKGVVVLDTSGHRPMFEQADEFQDVMVRNVLTDAAGGG
jgi:pimeloyl-ACP methyl ester carboxylesterase